jgi:Flp pilus assembly CpaF family ATPase
MKKVVRLSYALALTLLWACSDKDDASPNVIVVEDYQQLSVAGNIIVRYKQDESNDENKHEVHIITDGYQDH